MSFFRKPKPRIMIVTTDSGDRVFEGVTEWMKHNQWDGRSTDLYMFGPDSNRAIGCVEKGTWSSFRFAGETVHSIATG